MEVTASSWEKCLLFKFVCSICLLGVHHVRGLPLEGLTGGVGWRGQRELFVPKSMARCARSRYNALSGMLRSQGLRRGVTRPNQALQNMRQIQSNHGHVRGISLEPNNNARGGSICPSRPMATWQGVVVFWA
ncbi:hypothetical protein F5144DRAFT_374614 [Chaetomium tenue]|uniref:Uncharacterized protein n=1 Tax=Chaetomium tenue TaxID=1854479 RepID=A0ACB7NZV9_9PEZI|nr:hypothetical protein F5144DRAFT_374614 [Chaetomium globosum]